MFSEDELPKLMSAKYTLVKETRWTRTYATADNRCTSIHSRFIDGTAAIELEELVGVWANWSAEEKLDFCQSYSCACLSDSAPILRFIVANGDHNTWSTIALSVSSHLPPNEAIAILREWCSSSLDVVPAANYFQALANAGDPEAHVILNCRLGQLLSKAGLMDGSRNLIALDVVWCIHELLEIGEDLDSLRPTFEMLKNHPCETTRRQTMRWLAAHFDRSE